MKRIVRCSLRVVSRLSIGRSMVAVSAHPANTCTEDLKRCAMPNAHTFTIRASSQPVRTIMGLCLRLPEYDPVRSVARDEYALHYSLSTNKYNS